MQTTRAGTGRQSVPCLKQYAISSSPALMLQKRCLGLSALPAFSCPLIIYCIINEEKAVSVAVRDVMALTEVDYHSLAAL